jgi:hypothetical protein
LQEKCDRHRQDGDGEKSYLINCSFTDSFLHIRVL